MPEQWYYVSLGEVRGPVSGDELRALAERGELLPDDVVQHPGMPGWKAAKSVPGLFPGGGGADPGGARRPAPRSRTRVWVAVAAVAAVAAGGAVAAVWFAVGGRPAGDAAGVGAEPLLAEPINFLQSRPDPAYAEQAVADHAANRLVVTGLNGVSFRPDRQPVRDLTTTALVGAISPPAGRVEPPRALAVSHRVGGTVVATSEFVIDGLKDQGGGPFTAYTTKHGHLVALASTPTGPESPGEYYTPIFRLDEAARTRRLILTAVRNVRLGGRYPVLADGKLIGYYDGSGALVTELPAPKPHLRRAPAPTNTDTVLDGIRGHDGADYLLYLLPDRSVIGLASVKWVQGAAR